MIRGGQPDPEVFSQIEEFGSVGDILGGFEAGGTNGTRPDDDDNGPTIRLFRPDDD